MNDWIPPGYVSVVSLVREQGIDKVRSDLFSGHRQAFEWDGTAPALIPIEPARWCAHVAEQWLTTGAWPHRSGERPPCLIVVQVAEEEAKPQPTTDGAYLSPFMRMMSDAIRHFEIREGHWPKKKELEEYFREQKLPDGTPVSPNQASYLATFCRPLEAMSGGNKG